MKKNSILLSISIVLILLSGCVSSQPSNAKAILNVKVIATDTKTPLSIHFFTLKSNEVFKKLDYFELVSSKRINWNGELISRAKTLLTPGNTEIFQVQLTPDIQYYALIIGFKDVEDNDNWRYIRAVDYNSDNNIALRLSQVNGYTSKAVTRIKHNKNKNKNNIIEKKVINIGDKVSDKVDNSANQAIDSGINNIFGKIFK